MSLAITSAGSSIAIGSPPSTVTLAGFQAVADFTEIAEVVDIGEFGKKYKITGTPTLIFADGSRVPGAINAQQVEKFLAEAK